MRGFTASAAALFLPAASTSMLAKDSSSASEISERRRVDVEDSGAEED